MKYLLLLFSCFQLSLHAQTTVVGIRKENAIYVGADSKGKILVYAEDSDTMSAKPATFCKLWANEEAGFALSGAYLEQSKAVAIHVCNSYKDLDTIVAVYTNIYGNGILEALTAMKKNKLFEYRRSFDTTDYTPISEINFFSRIGGQLRTKSVRFYNKKNESPSVDITIDTYDDTLIAGGKVDHIWHKLVSSTTWKNEKNIFATIESLINTEANHHPESVGGEIDLIKVTKERITWIRRKKLCQN